MAVSDLDHVVDIETNPLVLSYLRYLFEIKDRYYQLSPDESTLFPILDPNFINYKVEQSRGIADEVLEIVSRLGQIRNLTSSSPDRDFWKGDKFTISFETGDVVYEFQSDIGFHVPVQIVLKGPSYYDGVPIVNQSQYNVTFDLAFDSTLGKDALFIETWKLYIKESTS